MSEDDKTPVQTPSAMLRLGLESCPLCNRTGVTSGIKCWYCNGSRVVTIEMAEKWRAAHAKTDPAPPEK